MAQGQSGNVAGGAHARWAAGPGAEALERVYSRSVALSGDAVVVFFRALAAVSQEELAPEDATEAPRFAPACGPWTRSFALSALCRMGRCASPASMRKRNDYAFISSYVQCDRACSALA